MIAALTALLIATAPADPPSMTPQQFAAIMHALIDDPGAPCVQAAPIVLPGGLRDVTVICHLVMAPPPK